MVPVLIIVGLFVVYELMNQGNVLNSLTANQSSQNAPLSQPLPGYTEVQGTDTGVSAGAQSAIQASNAALNFIPVVGPAISAVASLVAGSLIKASAARAAAARSENAAVGAAVPGWDAALDQVISNYNAGKIQASDVQQFLAVPQSNDTSVASGQGLLWVNFWKEVGPQVQPGRNGCQSGSVVQGQTSFCGGTTYGAGCCVAYDDLKNSSVNVLRALNQTEATGAPVKASILIVVASKYGGV